MFETCRNCIRAHLSSEKSRRILFFVTVSPFDPNLRHTVVIVIVSAYLVLSCFWLCTVLVFAKDHISDLILMLGPAENPVSTCCIERRQQSCLIPKNGLLYQFWKYLNRRLSFKAKKQAQKVYLKTSQQRARRETKLRVKMKM